MVKDRICGVDEEGNLIKSRPDYALWIIEDREEDKKREENPRWIRTKKLAAQLNIPIVVIDREKFAEREQNKIEKMKEIVLSGQNDIEKYGEDFSKGETVMRRVVSTLVCAALAAVVFAGLCGLFAPRADAQQREQKDAQRENSTYYVIDLDGATLYDVVLVNAGADPEAVAEALYKYAGVSKGEAEEMVKDTPCLVFWSDSNCDADRVRRHLERAGARVNKR